MYKRIVGLLLIFALVFCTLVLAQDKEEGKFLLSDSGFELSGDMSIFSQYIWRGFVLDRDAVYQPSIYISTPNTKFGRIKGGLWSNVPLQNNDNLSSEEFDYVFDYTYDFKYASISLGHTYYDFVGTKTFSREFYVGLTFPKLFLSPSVYYYRDYGDHNHGGGLGNYIVINTAYSLPVPIKNMACSLDLSGHVGFNHNLFMDGDGGDVALKAGFTIPLAKNLKFTPNVNYSIPFGDLADESHGNQKNRFFGGATICYVF